MNILFVINSLGIGGAETQVTSLAERLAATGECVTIAYILEPAYVRPAHPGVRLVWLGGSKSLLGMLLAFRGLYRLFKLLRPDVVHSHMFHANILARAVRCFAPIPRLISSTHSNNEGGRLRMVVYRMSNFLSDVFTGVSHDATNTLARKGAARIGQMICVSNGIDVNRFAYSECARVEVRKRLNLEGKVVFIAVGRLHEAKDYPNLIRAFGGVVEKWPTAHLLIVGEGQLRARIELLLRECGLSSRVTLLGARSDIPQLLCGADIFVLSSAWEGFGLVVAEAMACERLVVVTNSGGVREVVGEAGLVVPPGDSYALSRAMMAALQLPAATAAKLGLQARARIVAMFSLDAVVQRWREIYEG